MYKLGKHSLNELQGVHPLLVKVVKRAIELTSQDFTVHDGLRSLAQQEEYVKRGVSQTLRSAHLVQPDGHGHAVDLVPYIGGRLRWELLPCVHIAEAVREAAEQYRVELLWGGCWQPIRDGRYPGKMIDDYIRRKHAVGRRPFVDAPHYELILP